MLRQPLQIIFALYICAIVVHTAYLACDAYYHAIPRLEDHDRNARLCDENHTLSRGHHNECQRDRAHRAMSPLTFALRDTAASFTACPPLGCAKLVSSFTGAIGFASIGILAAGAAAVVTAIIALWLLARVRHTIHPQFAPQTIGRVEQSHATAGLRRRVVASTTPRITELA